MPDDHPDHVAQEGVGLDHQHELVAARPPLAGRHGPVEEDVLGARRRERAQVVGAHEERGGGVHRLRVEAAGVVQDAAAAQRRRRAAEHPVLVAAGPRVAARVEAGRGLGDGRHRQVGRQQAGQAPQDAGGRQVAGRW